MSVWKCMKNESFLNGPSPPSLCLRIGLLYLPLWQWVIFVWLFCIWRWDVVVENMPCIYEPPNTPSLLSALLGMTLVVPKPLLGPSTTKHASGMHRSRPDELYWNEHLYCTKQRIYLFSSIISSVISSDMTQSPVKVENLDLITVTSLIPKTEPDAQKEPSFP